MWPGDGPYKRRRQEQARQKPSQGAVFRSSLGEKRQQDEVERDEQGNRFECDSARPNGDNSALRKELHRMVTQQQYDAQKKNPCGMKSPAQHPSANTPRIAEEVNPEP